MLVLARKEGERIVIDFPGQRVIVQVCQVRGDRVRLGFDAPRGVPVAREEIAVPTTTPSAEGRKAVGA